MRPPPRSTLFPSTSLFRSTHALLCQLANGSLLSPASTRFMLSVLRADGGFVDGIRRDLTLDQRRRRSEEHRSELQSRQYLVCRLLLEKTKTPRSRSGIAQF